MHQSVPLLKAGSVHLWYSLESSLSISEQKRALEALDKTEKERYASIGKKKMQERFLFSRLMMRSLLSRYLAVRFSEIRYRYRKEGRPELAGCAEGKLSFNLSHSGSVTCLAICNSKTGTLGLDIETEGRRRPVLPLAERFFTEEEISFLKEAESKPEQKKRFFSLWNLKEALGKACAKGLAPVLKGSRLQIVEDGDISLTLLDESLQKEYPAMLWHFHQFELSEDCRGALACFRPDGGGAPELSYYSYSPNLS